MFNNKLAVDQSVARALYSDGIQFSVKNNYYFKQALSDVAKFGSGYNPPSEFSLHTCLLQNEVSKLRSEFDSVVLSELNTTGGTIVSDG